VPIFEVEEKAKKEKRHQPVKIQAPHPSFFFLFFLPSTPKAQPSMAAVP